MITDHETVEYFNKYVPEYSLERFDHIVGFLNSHATAESRLMDVGCGLGNTLDYIKTKTPIQHVSGIDVAENVLVKAKERLGCETFRGSVIDTAFMEGISKKYDFVLLAAVLHHLIGNTRRQSMRLSELAVENALRLVTPGGYLMVFEPVIYPALSAALLFHTKRIVTKFTSSRVQLFDKWNNIGAPVISYYTNEKLRAMIERVSGCRILDMNVEEKGVNLLWRAGGIRRRLDTTLVAQKATAGGV
jgi:SAM-dependent methyltransferase